MSNREALERDVRVAIWNAGCKAGLPQEIAQAVIRAAMEEPLMTRVLDATPTPAVEEVERLREREALLMVAIEKLADIVAYETPDDMTPAEVDDQRYRKATPILVALGMEIAGDERPAWGFDWTADPATEAAARAALSHEGR